MQNLNEIASKIFATEEEVIAIQIRQLDDCIDIRKSTLATMASDKIMHAGRLFLRSVHFRTF